jgi:hypothetical protein
MEMSTSPGGTERYTALISFCGAVSEEIDVDATTPAQARELAQAILERDYDAGCEIVEIIGPRVGLYL